MVNEVAKGTVVLVGGGEDRSAEYVILLRFLELAGGADARIVLIGSASTIPEELGRSTRRPSADSAAPTS